jgi:hypothetical protein
MIPHATAADLGPPSVCWHAHAHAHARCNHHTPVFTATPHYLILSHSVHMLFRMPFRVLFHNAVPLKQHDFPGKNESMNCVLDVFSNDLTTKL